MNFTDTESIRTLDGNQWKFFQSLSMEDQTRLIKSGDLLKEVEKEFNSQKENNQSNTIVEPLVMNITKGKYNLFFLLIFIV